MNTEKELSAAFRELEEGAFLKDRALSKGRMNRHDGATLPGARDRRFRFGGAMEKIALSLVKAGLKDAPEIHAMQREAFKPLLAKYQDFDISPGAEPLEKVQERLRQDFTHFYIVKLGETSIGAVRVVLKDTGERCRISPIFILPEHQNRGFAQEVFRLIEKLYSPRNGWELDTILEEEGNCHLYEKLGYRKTGEFKKIKPGMTLVFYEKTEINLFKGAHESA